MTDTKEYRIARLERRCRSLLLLNIGIIVLTAYSLVGYRSDFIARAQSIDDPQVITVSQINVVDENGVVRARIGGDLPDAVINGKTMPRGEKVAGVLLYDGTGQERSGYVTGSSGNVFLTLDTRTKQTALFAAGRSGGAALRLSFQDDAVDLPRRRRWAEHPRCARGAGRVPPAPGRRPREFRAMPGPTRRCRPRY